MAQAVPLPPPLQEDKGDGGNGKSSAKEEEEETPSISIRDLSAKLGVVDWILSSKWKKVVHELWVGLEELWAEERIGSGFHKSLAN